MHRFNAGWGLGTASQGRRVRLRKGSPTMIRVARHQFGDARPVIDAGGLFEYARRNGMIASNLEPDVREAVPVNRVVED